MSCQAPAANLDHRWISAPTLFAVARKRPSIGTSSLRRFGEKHKQRCHQTDQSEHAECNCVALSHIVKKSRDDRTEKGARSYHRPAHALDGRESSRAEIVGANRFL